MHRRLSSFIGWRKTSQKLTHLGLRVLSILSLAFGFVGANPASDVQAAPDREGFTFVMNAVPSAKYVCTGESMTFKVSISIQLENQPGDTAPKFGHIRGAWIFADLVRGEGGGGISPSDSFFGSSEEIAPDSATFKFTADDYPGTKTLRFTSSVGEFWLGSGNYNQDTPQDISTTAKIEVRNCGYKVLLISIAPVPGMGLWVSSPKEIRLQETSSKQFSSSTDWNLIYNDFNTMGCPVTTKVTPNKVEYQAHLNGERLYLDYTIQEFTETVTIICPGPELGNPPPIIFTVPAGTGTVSVPSQGGVIAVPAGLGGSHFFIITRVSDEETDQ